MATIREVYVAPVASGGDYSSLWSAELSEETDLVYTDQIMKFRCAAYRDGTMTDFNNWVTGPDNYIEIYGEKKMDWRNMSYGRAYRLYNQTNYDGAFMLRTMYSYVRLRDIIVHDYSSYQTYGMYVYGAGGSEEHGEGYGDFRAKRCLFYGQFAGMRIQNNYDAAFYNCAFIGGSHAVARQGSNRVAFYNCVGVNGNVYGNPCWDMSYNRTDGSGSAPHVMINCMAMCHHTLKTNPDWPSWVPYAGCSGQYSTFKSCGSCGGPMHALNGVWDHQVSSRPELSGISHDANYYETTEWGEGYWTTPEAVPYYLGTGGTHYLSQYWNLTVSGFEKIGQHGVDLTQDPDFLADQAAEWLVYDEFTGAENVPLDVHGEVYGTGGPSGVEASGFAVGMDQYLGSPFSVQVSSGSIGGIVKVIPPSGNWFPNENPNTPGVSSGIISLGQSADIVAYWPFNDPSGAWREDIAHGRNLLTHGHKKRFPAPYEHLNDGLAAYWDLEEFGNDLRRDAVSGIWLREYYNSFTYDADSAPVLRGGNIGSGTHCRRTLYGILYTLEAAQRNRLSPGSGDFTIACWTYWNGLESTLYNGIVSKLANSNREYGLYRIASNNPVVPRQDRLTWLVEGSAVDTEYQAVVTASGENNGAGDGTAPKMQANIPYFVVCRIKPASGWIDITMASGHEYQSDWSTRIYNRSDPQAWLPNGVYEGTQNFYINSINFGTDRYHNGGTDEVGVWKRYLSDDELEELWNNGYGRTVEPVYNSVDQLTMPTDPAGPGVDRTNHKLGSGCAIFDNIGTPVFHAGEDGEHFMLPYHQGGDAFHFDGTESFTCAGWVKLGDVYTRIIMGVGEEKNWHRQWRFRHNNANRQFYFQVSSNGSSWTQSVYTTGGSKALDTWYFVAFGYDADTNEIWISYNNGTPATAAGPTSLNSNSRAPFRLGGGYASTSSFSIFANGGLDAWGIWKKHLSDSELETLYNAGNGLEMQPGYIDAYFDPAWIGFDQKGNSFGGYTTSRARDDQFKVDFMGGLIKAPPGGTKIGYLGGYCMSEPRHTMPTVFVGGVASGMYQKRADIGGWIFGGPSGSNFVENHSRTLVKARSEDTVGQALNLDATLRMMGESEQEYNARLLIYHSDNAEFNAKLNVQAYKLPPIATITNVSTSGGPGDCITVTVTASGQLRDGYEFNNEQIDFGQPLENDYLNYGTWNDPSRAVSGWVGDNKVITASYTYCASGIYVVVARFQDNEGMVGSDSVRLDFLSHSGSMSAVGINGVPQAGVDYPAFAVSGQPRTGYVPEYLRVDYNVESSGFALFDKSGIHRNAVWNFGNRSWSYSKSQYSNYLSPGTYIPTYRMKYVATHPSGAGYGQQVIWVSDSLEVGVNI